MPQRPSAPILAVEGLFLLHQDNLSYGPLNLSLAAGQGALVVGGDLGLLRRLMRCCLDWETPAQGKIKWWPGAEDDQSIWGRHDFYHQIGYVDRQCQLLGKLTLFDNLTLYDRFIGAPDRSDSIRDLLAGLGLAEEEFVKAGDLPEPQRRLALYALALNQNPRLMLLERPIQFLDRDFDRVWDIILRRAAQGELAYVVFDRTRTLYNQDHFQTTTSFTLGLPGHVPWTQV